MDLIPFSYIHTDNASSVVQSVARLPSAVAEILGLNDIRPRE
jgi:hypothetical protein